MDKTLGEVFGEKKLRKIAHRCDMVLRLYPLKAHWAWYGTSIGGSINAWEEYVRNFLTAYKRIYFAGHRKMVAVATLLSSAEIYGIISQGYKPDQLMCTLNKNCQMGAAGLYAYLPICKIEDDATIARAMEAPASGTHFAIKVKCCDEEDGDPRFTNATKIRRIMFKV